MEYYNAMGEAISYSPDEFLHSSEPAKSFRDLVGEFHEQSHVLPSGEQLLFRGIGEKDAYNPVLIVEGDKHYLAVRVESRDSHWLNTATYDPQLWFFHKKGDCWEPVENSPVFDQMEDPFAAWLPNEDGDMKLVFGGVGLDRSTDPPTIVTQFFEADSVMGLSQSRGPVAEVRGMKDVRLLALPGGEIAVCTRPQGGMQAGLGKVGFTTLKRYAHLSSENAWKAPLVMGQITEECKLGPNELYLLKNEKGVPLVGVLGHVAHIDEQDTLHYYAASWTINPTERTATRPRLLAGRSNFEEGPVKAPIFKDIVFSGSLECLPNGQVKLWAGLSDVSCGSIVVPDPFAGQWAN